MNNFFQSWAFWFLIGCFVGGAIGFIGAAILAASSRASRAEEEWEARRKKFASDDMTKQVEDILGRKTG